MTASAAHPFAGSCRRSGSTSCIRSVWHRDHRAADREQARTKRDSPMIHARPHRRSRPSRRPPLRGGRSHDQFRNIDGGRVSLAQFLERDGALVPREPDRAAHPSPTHRQTYFHCIKGEPSQWRESSPSLRLAVSEDAGVPSADRQRVSAGRRASPNWIVGRAVLVQGRRTRDRAYNCRGTPRQVRPRGCPGWSGSAA